MDFVFFIMRVPVYVAGLAICIIALPFDLIALLIEYFGIHVLITFFRVLGIPFVIVNSAYFDRDSWSRYQSNWQKAYDNIRPDWDRPFRRFPELNKWLIKGPGNNHNV